jgi:diguanylate cyclase (GGDEF)-like protein
VPDLRIDTQFPTFSPRAFEAGLAAAFSFPLLHGKRKVGILDLYRTTAGPLSEVDTAFAQTMAEIATAYLVNAQTRTDLRDQSERSREVSLHDPLTGLANRTLLVERIEHALQRCATSGRQVAVLFIDLDRFKKVNDVHGHHIGDQLLITVAERIVDLVRPGDTVARISGDEFVAVCEVLNDETGVSQIADRLVESLGHPFELEGTSVRLSASVGIACSSDGGGDSSEKMLHKADMAMYQVKRKGGNGQQVINRPEQDITTYAETLKDNLDSALERQEFRLEYQPIVRTSDGVIVGAEALLRWDHSTLGPITPATLIPLAEESGSIVEIGDWVLEQACEDRLRWQYATMQPFVMAVNISAFQLMSPNLADTVSTVLANTKTDPGCLSLEVTEGAFVQDAERALTVLTELKRIGVGLALDDFGTGYSSLSYLKEFPVDTLKIDKHFIADLGENRASYAIVSKTIELAHMLDLVVVCEGVETAEQFRQVRALKSQLCQGFYCWRPMSATMLDDVMRTAQAS